MIPVEDGLGGDCVVVGVVGLGEILYDVCFTVFEGDEECGNTASHLSALDHI